MKRILPFLTIVFLFACKKDSQDNNRTSSPTSSNQISSTIYGTYTGSSNCSSTSTIDVISYSASSVKMKVNSIGLNYDTLIVNVNGNNLIVPSQSFPNTGWSGGTKSVSGSGTYSDPQITLTLSVVYVSTGHPTTTDNCTFGVIR